MFIAYDRLTFKDLKKVVSLGATIQQQSKVFQRLQGKPFWIWDIKEHKLEDIKTKGDCCFNHIIGLPKKDRIDKPVYDYEKIIFDSLNSSLSDNGNNVAIELDKFKQILNNKINEKKNQIFRLHTMSSIIL